MNFDELSKINDGGKASQTCQECCWASAMASSVLNIGKNRCSDAIRENYSSEVLRLALCSGDLHYLEPSVTLERAVFQIDLQVLPEWQDATGQEADMFDPSRANFVRTLDNCQQSLTIRHASHQAIQGISK